MISIIEGKPGTGKTYYAVTKITSYLEEGRDVQTNIEINVALLPLDQREHLHELDTNSANWYQKTLEGAVVFVDEFQNIEKDDSREVKKFQQYLSTHRHRINEEGKIGYFDVKKNQIRGKNENGAYYEVPGRARVVPRATLSSDGVRDFDPREYKGLSIN